MSACRVRVRTEGRAFRREMAPSPAPVQTSSAAADLTSSSAVNWIPRKVSDPVLCHNPKVEQLLSIYCLEII